MNYFKVGQMSRLIDKQLTSKDSLPNMHAWSICHHASDSDMLPLQINQTSVGHQSTSNNTATVMGQPTKETVRSDIDLKG
jgi:hypothetical protein